MKDKTIPEKKLR